MNFIYEVVSIIVEAPPGKEKILKRDDSMIKISIPALTIYKTLLKMR